MPKYLEVAEKQPIFAMSFGLSDAKTKENDNNDSHKRRNERKLHPAQCYCQP